MAYEVPILDIGTQVAGADLSAHQYKWVKIAADGRIVLCDVDGEMAFGILQNTPKENEEVSVRVEGISKIVVAQSETLGPGQLVGTTNVGTATRIQPTATGADLGDFMCGQMLEGLVGTNPAAGLATVLIRHQGRVTA